MQTTLNLSELLDLPATAIFAATPAFAGDSNNPPEAGSLEVDALFIGSAPALVNLWPALTPEQKQAVHAAVLEELEHSSAEPDADDVADERRALRAFRQRQRQAYASRRAS